MSDKSFFDQAAEIPDGLKALLLDCPVLFWKEVLEVLHVIDDLLYGMFKRQD